jgi:hypothetical protein
MPTIYCDELRAKDGFELPLRIYIKENELMQDREIAVRR